MVLEKVNLVVKKNGMMQVKKCKDTKHVQGDLDGLKRSRWDCVNEWNKNATN